MTEMRMVGLGDQVRVDSGHRAMTPDALTVALASAEKSGTHLWAMLMSHTISVSALERMATEPPVFDAETLLSSSIGCMVCEQMYEPRLLRRACPGDPTK